MAALPHPSTGKRRLRAPGASGFTLIELMVAVSLLAVVALLAWRGIDAMTRARDVTARHSDRVLELQTALAQWRADLDATLPDAAGAAAGEVLQWSGRTLQLLRLAPPDARMDPASGDAARTTRGLHTSTPGLVVVAWTQRDNCLPAGGDDATLAAGPCWLRWQSPVLHTLAEQQQAWQQATAWATQGGPAAPGGMQQQVLPLLQWQVLAWRNDAWAPPASSGRTDSSAQPANPAATGMPAAIRLQLTLPENAVLPGALTSDWINPTFTRRRG